MPNRTKSQVLRETTLKYLSTLDTDNPPDPVTIESELLEQIEQQYDLENSVKQKGRAWPIPQHLHNSQIAEIINHLYPVRRIICNGRDSDQDGTLLAFYQRQGCNQGIYMSSEDEFRGLFLPYNYQMTRHDLDEIMTTLRLMAPVVPRCSDPDLIPVNNGIFNYKTKQLLSFSPDMVFTAKSKVNYTAAAVNPIIHNSDDGTCWDVESWIGELSDDPEIVQLIWEILGAVIRPNVPWGKSAWLYSETGNNGKGTLCELMRNLVGNGSYASISVADFSREFMLEQLLHVSAIIVDENDVGTYIDAAANLKAIITNDVIGINRKYKTPINLQFRGFMVQCSNEFPRFKDKSDSFYRRQLFVPFDKCFTGRERKYIKSDYLHRQEVLEYVMYKVLHMDYYSLSEPAACKAVLAEYKEFNDPIRAFFEELADRFSWDFVPFEFAYDLYKAWFLENSPSGSIQGRNTFIKDLTNIVNSTSQDWTVDRNKMPVRPQGRMDWPEPLIAEYRLIKWLNPVYTGGDWEKRCLPPLKSSYRGLERVQPKGPPSMWNPGIVLTNSQTGL